MKPLKQTLLLTLLFLLFASPVLAHKVNLFAYAEGGKVFTESYFPDGRAVEGGKVLVYDSSDILLLKGTTDKQGFFNFPIPKIDNLNIIIEATMGHKNNFSLRKSEINEGK